MGILTSRAIASPLRKALGQYAKSAASTPFKMIGAPRNLFGSAGTIRSDLKTINAFTKGSKDIENMAKASGRLLGTAAGITYVSRAIKGRSPVKKASGKRDILPWVPFI